MAEIHRVHPLDLESSPPPPLAAPADETKKRIGQASSKPTTRRIRSRCCRCLCWTLLALFVLVVALGATVGFLYLAFDPKIPDYSVDRLTVANFSIRDNMTVSATFNLTITMTNRNRRIGIYYRGGSRMSALYGDRQLCTGTFPVFYQGHRNTTVLNVPLTGETQLGGELLRDLAEQQQTGMIPLVFRGKVPVRVRLGRLKLPRVTFRFRCDITVNSLSANNNISLRSSRCKFRLKL
ncbi:NDR1/HIN1-like protein 6 [Zingiber officinale]|uniref:Late embryogenesis abundant protein LEA-2 subgroup domain-containing protein n=1 Tax=Zingiber officinale TaxID=94328 RepID=A0A8J5C866_ZINOF|nr:NDR1/HIN1-like protein 6 [Zingiber officinale]KAG6470289.1 hypothetical protein ZIOFF_071354 [Zingiber officinale]